MTAEGWVVSGGRDGILPRSLPDAVATISGGHPVDDKWKGETGDDRLSTACCPCEAIDKARPRARDWGHGCSRLATGIGGQMQNCTAQNP